MSYIIVTVIESYVERPQPDLGYREVETHSLRGALRRKHRIAQVELPVLTV